MKKSTVIEKIKKILGHIFGTSENIRFKLTISLLTVAILFCILSTLSQENPDSSAVLASISAIFFYIWLCICAFSDSWSRIITEFFRLFIFFFIFMLSTYSCLMFALDYTSISIVYVVLSSIGLFLCIYYLFCKLTDIFYFIKNIFLKINQFLFNTSNPASTKLRALIENMTALILAISSLAVAVKSMVDLVCQAIEHLK